MRSTTDQGWIACRRPYAFWRCPRSLRGAMIGGVNARSGAVRRGAAALCAALILAGCSSGPDPGPTPGPSDDTSSRSTSSTSSTSSEPLTPVSFDLNGLWQPEATQCKGVEAEVPQPAATADLLRACRPPAGTSPVYLRLVNLSDTTLVLGVGKDRDVKRFFAPKETELTKAGLKAARAVGDISLQGAYLPDTGDLHLPARFSAMVVDFGEQATVPIVNFPRHGQAVSNVRAISALAAQMPYSKLASVPLLGAKVAGCALDAAKKVNDDNVTIQEAMSLVKTCKGMVDDLREKWQEYRAAEVRAGKLPTFGLPQESDDILRGMSRETGPITSVWEDIARTVPKALAQAHR